MPKNKYMDSQKIIDVGLQLIDLVADFQADYGKLPCPKANDLSKAHKALAYMFNVVKFSEYEKISCGGKSDK